MAALILLAAVISGGAATAFHFASAIRMAAGQTHAAGQRTVSKISLPLFFEPNHGQTDPRVKFLAHGKGYGLFLTNDEAVMELQPAGGGRQESAVRSQESANAPSVIRMRLVGANSSARVSGAAPLPGKSNYFIGNDPAKWRRGIPQFARVNYASVYPGIDLTYYGQQGQLEYDFRVAPGGDPSQIALTFDGATARLESGDLVLATGQGELRFHAPHIYQLDGAAQKAVTGSFQQLAENRIGFTIGSYDRSRELVIDPTLSYATWFGQGSESLTQVAVDTGLNVYVAFSTFANSFTLTQNPFQAQNNGGQDVFLAEINPSGNTLLYASYLGGSGNDRLAGLTVDPNFNVYVAGTTDSGDFPTTTNAFQQTASGTHGFLTKFNAQSGLTTLAYSTYLAGNQTDQVTGLAINSSSNKGWAYVTGTTTSTNAADGFPSTGNAYQQCPFQPGTTCAAPITPPPPQFFASVINTTGTGNASMLYSTYFGGGYGTTVSGGGIAVDPNGNMYFTGGTNTPGVTGPNGEAAFPLLNASDSCLNFTNQGICPTNSTALDGFAAKINPSLPGTAGLVYSTYMGGSGDDAATAIAVDSAANAYITGSTSSGDFFKPAGLVTPFQATYGGGGDAFVVKIGNPTGTNTIYPMTYFTYIGGSGFDVGQGIAVDTVQGTHVTGSTNSGDLPVVNPTQTYGNNTDAFVGLISTTNAGGNYLTWLGGSSLDEGTSVAIDANANTYVGGITQSADLPTNPQFPPLQPQLNGTQDAFIAKIGASSTFVLDPNPPVVTPNPVGVGNQASFAFEFKNNGPDPATNVVFIGTLPPANFTFSSASSTPGGACPTPIGNKVLCQVGSVAVGGTATVTVVLVPTTGATSLSVTPTLSANGNSFTTFAPGTVQVTDFAITVAPTSRTVNAGESTSYVVTLTPVPTYSATITVSQTGLPTASTGTFTSTSVTLSGTSPGSTTLNVSTTARPVTGGSLFHGGNVLYATWLPVGGLSLLGLGLGASQKRRRWLAGAVLGFVAAIITVQPGCGSSSSTTPPGGGTPAGTYTIKITAAAGSASHTYPVTLIVN